MAQQVSALRQTVFSCWDAISSTLFRGKKPQNNKKKKQTPSMHFSPSIFMAACDCNIWMHSQQWSPQSIRLLKAALPEEKLSFQMDRRERMEENISVDLVLLMVAKSDL